MRRSLLEFELCRLTRVGWLLLVVTVLFVLVGGTAALAVFGQMFPKASSLGTGLIVPVVFAAGLLFVGGARLLGGVGHPIVKPRAPDEDRDDPDPFA